jgi:GMP synthase-like glutamine amidotransferase
MRAICLQHVPFEGPAAFAVALKKHDVELRQVLVPREGLPNDPGDLLIVMGGPMSVNDPDPWIAEETDFIQRAMQAGIPTLGVCLGSQFMAKAIGATVRPGRGVEIGMTAIQVTEEGRKDPVFGTLPPSLEVFQWHGEGYDCPPGAVTLASSELFSVQAFRYGNRAYGLLFHLEMDQPGMEALCRECADDMARARQTIDDLRGRAIPALPQLHQWADRLIAHLIRLS